ncbi:hypothetical protein M9Y10_008834 [Tritrichomonas musculus]|uniref:Uncharacterized protein n=1 Tax=Tritrichomonas musculus TaxID=1915356 RepID=A0ABR2IZJ2_9EUKA
MFFILYALLFRKLNTEWGRIQTITDSVVGSSFGRSVAISNSKERIVVGADGEQDGRIYVYDYTFVRQWNRSAVISPKSNSDIFINSLGYTVSISSDGNRIIAGAPKSRVDGADVGCVIIFDYIDNTWIQNDPVCPEPASNIHGFGHILTTSMDCKYFATATHNSNFDIEINNTGMVFISSEGVDRKWSTPKALISLDKVEANYGTDLHFLDASTILVAVDDLKIGTLIYKRNANNEWIQKDRILPIPLDNWTKEGITNYGKHIAMPSVDNSIMAITATKDTQKAGFAFILKKNKKKWELMSHVVFPEKAFLDDVFFCDVEYLASPSKLNNNGIGAVNLFKKVDQKFVFTETISPAENENIKTFGSSFTWNSRCNRFVVGATGDHFTKGSIFIYSRFGRYFYRYNINKQDTKSMAIIICSSIIIFALVIIIAISIAFLFMKYNQVRDLQPVSVD